MFQRIIQLTDKNSFFLFGARNTGKSTLINALFKNKRCFWINLLKASEEKRYSSNPDELYAIVKAQENSIDYVIIDEVQKVPALLDTVHQLIAETSIKFILTGSSARKLKQKGVNLLAGRAFIFHLYPLSFIELGTDFHLEEVLHWGSLPNAVTSKTISEKKRFLRAYAQTYLKEEIWLEQLIRNLHPFRRFLEVAAQCNGKVINYANIARDTGIDDKTVKNYFTLLEDTLVGFTLEPFQNSFRKRLSLKPKFYFFDIGVVRALSGYLSLPLQAGTSQYGEVFEHFIILECLKLADYYELDYRFSYILTKDQVEVDLVVERPGQPLLFIEIKSTDHVEDIKLSSYKKLTSEIEGCEAVCFSKDPHKKQYDNITIWPWQEGIRHYFSKTAE